MPANLENSAVATGLEKFSFYSNRKERQSQRVFKLPHNCTHLTHSEKAMAPHSSILAWKIPWTEEPGGLQSTGSQRVGHYGATLPSPSHANKVMLEILQARLQQYMNHELPDVQAEFSKGRGSRDQIATICLLIEKARESQ